MHIINSTQIMLLISHRNVIENHVLVSLKKLLKKICLQDAIYLKNNELVTFKISCKSNFKGKFVLMFAGRFLRVLSLFWTIPKWFALFIYLIWINIFTVGMQLKILGLKAISVAEVEICLIRDMVLDI